MASADPSETGGLSAVVRYRGFLLIPQADLSWLVQPSRGTAGLLSFQAPASSLADVKALVDWRLAQGTRNMAA
ncbi:hypothetical protein KBY90_10410 [Cyanobium sp. CH-040]|nr:hypothetical protein [Cyanobium sp. CH-040]MCP9928288.1 hypothetical protein [Cyanobium sp. CH-040]